MVGAGAGTMCDPAFTQTIQVGIAVRDLDAMNGRLREHGRPVQRSWRLAVARVGQLQWELIGPLDDEGSG